MRRFLENWKMAMAALAVTAGVISGGATFAWDAWAGYSDLRSQVASNTRSILATRFFELDKKRTSYGLSPAEYNEFCSIGRQLGYFVTCPPARG